MNRDIDDIFKKYKRKIEQQIETENLDTGSFSREFMQFKTEMYPKISRYEGFCKSLGNIFLIKLGNKDKERIQKHIDTAHLDITPSQTMTLAVTILILTFFTGALIFALAFILSGAFSLLIIFSTLIMSMFLFYYFYSMPERIAVKWRLKAASQMVPCVLYVVAYMKHTSNLERAIVFASKHLQPPLALDFKKIFWDVETGRFSTLKESLEAYLETWRESNMEFVESFHLIESSLYEPSESDRIKILERALQVILDGVYDRMLKYARDVRSPLTSVYMLGVVLPTLGLSLVPLASTLLKGAIQWYHLVLFFDVMIPFFVFYLVNSVLLKRPGGYGESDAVELNPDYPLFKSKKPYLVSGLIAFPIFLIGILPFLFQFTSFPSLIGMPKDFTFAEIGLGFLGNAKFFDFSVVNGAVTGPFGLGAAILSLFVPLSFAMFFWIAYKKKTKNIIETREDTRKLENEFTNSLFQLGNRLGDGVPAEIAFSYVAESTRGQITEGFFRTVNTNLHQLGMSLEQAIFNQRRGAIVYYPSALVSMSMKILIESVKKGLQIAARSLMSISEYIKNIGKINERMKDLLAEVVSDMKSNMTFLAPLLAGIVVGLGDMIINILGQLSVLQELRASGAEVSIPFAGITQMFEKTFMIPPYFLQLAVGIYIIEIIFILSSALVSIDAGEDNLRTVYETGRNLKRGVMLYIIVTFIAMLALSMLASIAIGGGLG